MMGTGMRRILEANCCSQNCKVNSPNVSIFDKKYRSSLEIIASILKVASNGASRFAIASRLNTNYILLHRYLNYLTKIGFIITEVGEKQILYKTCEKGLEFLRLYYTLLKMLSGTAETQIHANVGQRACQIAVHNV